MISQSEILQRAETELELDTDAKRATEKTTQFDSTNLLEENLRFLGQALKINFELGPKQTCSQLLEEKNELCGAKVRDLLIFKTCIWKYFHL